ncbi:hypothetical protein JCM10212_001052 [Sporobolomyces blumeae]
MSSSSVANSSDKPSLVQRKLDQGLAVAKEDAKAISSLGTEAVRSAAYLYPLRGLFYVLQHPKMARSLTPLLMRTLGISAITVMVMFLFTYFPQVAFFAIVSGPLAFAVAVPVVLAESYLVLQFLLRTLISPQLNERIFDAILIQRGHTELVERGRKISRGSGGVSLGKSLLKPVRKFSVEGLVRYIVTLPLNLIPGVGTAVFLALNGWKAGPAAHARYFELKDLKGKARQEYVERRRGAYTAFGASSLLLNLIPLLGPFFSFTSCAGAALWAADLEDSEQKKQVGAGQGEDVVDVAEDEE